MNGYSKMRPTNKKTRSMDFLDLLSFSSPTQETKANTSPKSPEPSKNNNQHPRDSPPKVEEEEEDANPRNTAVNGAAVKLMRTCSVAASGSTSSPARFRLERQSSRRTTSSSSGIQSAVRRVFSMRRSSSVSERYCRIYDQHVALEPAAIDDGGDDDSEAATDNDAMKARSIKTKKKNGILKACRRLLGF